MIYNRLGKSVGFAGTLGLGSIIWVVGGLMYGELTNNVNLPPSRYQTDFKRNRAIGTTIEICGTQSTIKEGNTTFYLLQPQGEKPLRWDAHAIPGNPLRFKGTNDATDLESLTLPSQICLQGAFFEDHFGAYRMRTGETVVCLLERYE